MEQECEASGTGQQSLPLWQTEAALAHKTSVGGQGRAQQTHYACKKCDNENKIGGMHQRHNEVLCKAKFNNLLLV